MKISFCTTCMGRQEHVEQTLLKNIRNNEPKNPGDPDVEFVLVEYGRKDKLKEMIENNAELKRYHDNGTLVYRQYPDAKIFHHAHAKNMAHRLATGDVVCNLDADNFTGEGFARYLAKEFAGNRHAIVHPAFSTFNGIPPECFGFYGRIAALREDFLALGGYSETRFNKGWGGEDCDFIRRSLAHGLEPLPMFNMDFFKVISNTNEERVQNTAGGTTAQEVEEISAGRISMLRNMRDTFGTYALSVQANRAWHSGKFGLGTVLTLGGEVQKIEAVRPFPHIFRRGIHARKAMKIDNAIQPPEQTIGV